MTPIFVKGEEPIQGSELAAGYDIKAAETVTIEPGQTVLVPTKTSLKAPKGVATLLLPRSSLANKKSLILVNSIGVVDPDYVGIIHAPFRNIGDEPVTLTVDERIGQLLFIQVIHPYFAMVDELPSTPRGTGSFGSTGTH